MAAERLVGLLLIVVGVMLFVLLETGLGGEGIPLLIGVGFLVAYAVTRLYGLLIPGGILTGLGSGIVVTATTGPDAAPVLGLGMGFVAIALVDWGVRGRERAQWWPLIPGGILTVIGLVAIPEVRATAQYVVPLLLIAGGLWLVLGHRRRAKPAQARPASTVPPAPTEDPPKDP